MKINKTILAFFCLSFLSLCGCSSSDSPPPVDPPPSSNWGDMVWGESNWNNQ